MADVPASRPTEPPDNCPYLRVDIMPRNGWVSAAKAAEDKLISVMAVVLLLPLFALVALAIWIDSPGPVIFRQKRVGLNGQLIEVYKFRTMFRELCDADAEKLTTKGDVRVTRVGRFLRRSGIDEFPQLLNVLYGDMSIVGPRPHALKARVRGKLYREAVAGYAERHCVKPGITGWAQVNGLRGELDSEEDLRRRVEYDIYYIGHRSIRLDLHIMLRTVIVMLSGRGAC
jgi:polysaccharide biosynthesis protein PslA